MLWVSSQGQTQALSSLRMLAVEEMKIAQQKCAKNISFVTKKTLSDHHVGIHLSLHESCGNLHSHRSSSVVCLNEEFYYVFDRSFACFANSLSVYSYPF